MRLLVFGATGGTGQVLLDQGLAQGHQMTAFVRNPAALEARPGLTIVQGDVTDAAAVGRAVAGHEAVLSALGPRGGGYGVLPGGVQNIVTAMSQAGVRRLIHVSSFGVGDSLAQMGWVARQVFVPLFLRKALDEKEIEEGIIRERPRLDHRPAGRTGGRPPDRRLPLHHRPAREDWPAAHCARRCGRLHVAEPGG